MSKYFRIIGSLLILAGCGILLSVYWPLAKQEWQYRRMNSVSRPMVRTNQSSFQESPLDSGFGLVIPAINVNVKVFPNIDDQNSGEYQSVLAKGVAHARWSALPDQKGVVFIFAHSADSPLNVTRYNAVFYLLGKLTMENEILVYFEEREYTYRVTDKKVVSPGQVRQEVENLSGEFLVLQTCHPPGTTLNRLLVIAHRKDTT